MISRVISNKGIQREKLVLTLERNRQIPRVLRFLVHIKCRIREYHVQSTAASEFVDCIPDAYETVYFNAPIHHLKTVIASFVEHHTNRNP